MPFGINGSLVFGPFWQVKLCESLRQQFLLGQGKLRALMSLTLDKLQKKIL
jgi:hypothetical protein